MMSHQGYQDRILTCRDCGQEFTFSAGEQEFFDSRGLTNAPGRCPSCRAARRNVQSSSSRSQGSGERYETFCATCGKPTSVPFVPREDRPVYCNECFQAQRANRAPRRDFSRSYSGSGYGGNRGRDHRSRRDDYDRW